MKGNVHLELNKTAFSACTRVAVTAAFGSTLSWMMPSTFGPLLVFSLDSSTDRVVAGEFLLAFSCRTNLPSSNDGAFHCIQAHKHHDTLNAFSSCKTPSTSGSCYCFFTGKSHPWVKWHLPRYNDRLAYASCTAINTCNPCGGLWLLEPKLSQT